MVWHPPSNYRNTLKKGKRKSVQVVVDSTLSGPMGRTVKRHDEIIMATSWVTCYSLNSRFNYGPQTKIALTWHNIQMKWKDFSRRDEKASHASAGTTFQPKSKNAYYWLFKTYKRALLSFNHDLRPQGQLSDTAFSRITCNMFKYLRKFMINYCNYQFQNRNTQKSSR